MVAADVTRALARVQSAAARVLQADRALRTGIITFNGHLEGLGQTRRLENVLVLTFRPQEAVYSLELLNVAFNEYFTTVAEYNRAQFELFHALGYPAREITAAAAPRRGRAGGHGAAGLPAAGGQRAAPGDPMSDGLIRVAFIRYEYIYRDSSMISLAGRWHIPLKAIALAMMGLGLLRFIGRGPRRRSRGRGPQGQEEPRRYHSRPVAGRRHARATAHPASTRAFKALVLDTIWDTATVATPGPGAEGGYPFYGGPGYPNCEPSLRRIGGINPFPYYGGPGYPTPGPPQLLRNVRPAGGRPTGRHDRRRSWYRYEPPALAPLPAVFPMPKPSSPHSRPGPRPVLHTMRLGPSYPGSVPRTRPRTPGLAHHVHLTSGHRARTAARPSSALGIDEEPVVDSSGVTRHQGIQRPSGNCGGEGRASCGRRDPLGQRLPDHRPWKPGVDHRHQGTGRSPVDEACAA